MLKWLTILSIIKYNNKMNDNQEPIQPQPSREEDSRYRAPQQDLDQQQIFRQDSPNIQTVNNAQQVDTVEPINNIQPNICAGSVSPTQLMNAHIETNEIKKPITKSILLYLARYFGVVIITGFAVYLYRSSVNTSGFMGGFAVLGAMMYAVPVAGLVLLIVNAIATSKFLKDIFGNSNGETLNKIFILKSCLVVVLSIFLTDFVDCGVSMIFGYSSAVNSPSYDYATYSAYLIVPIMILLTSFGFLRRELINRKTVNTSFLALSIIILGFQFMPLVMPYASLSSEYVFSWLTIFYLAIPIVGYMIFTVPAWSIIMVVLGRKDVSGDISKKTRILPIIISIIAIIATFAIVSLLSNIINDNNIQL